MADSNPTALTVMDDVARWMTETHKCCFCGKDFTGWGNNPEPIKEYDARCCNECNNRLVIPWRTQYGRDFKPQWLAYGLGKSHYVAHNPIPAHVGYDDDGTPIYKMDLEHINETTKLPEANNGFSLDEKFKRPAFWAHTDWNKKGPSLAEEKVWYGNKPGENDPVAQAINTALGQNKSHHGLIPVR